MPNIDERPNGGGNWFRPEAYPNKWGINYVRQSRESCWSASLAMLTGIDYPLLPVAPLATDKLINGVEGGGLATARERNRAWRKGMPAYMRAGGGRATNRNGTINEWKALLRDLGFKLSVTHKRPKNKPCGQLVNSGGHVAVLLPDGTYLDPNGGTPNWTGVDKLPYGGTVGLTDTYFVVTPISAPA